MGKHIETPDLQLEMYSQARFLAGARSLVSNVAQRIGFSQHQCGQMSLAVDEALCNIIKHGYDRSPDGRIWMRIWALDGEPPGIKIVLEDRARQVSIDSIKSRDLADIRPGGLGVFIIAEIMDEVHYEHREGGGMRLTMIRRVPPPSESDQQAGTGTAAPESSACRQENCHE
jgi:anti-sigma regulatory factor (Ser/Thr protein kinase)